MPDFFSELDSYDSGSFFVLRQRVRAEPRTVTAPLGVEAGHFCCAGVRLPEERSDPRRGQTYGYGAGAWLSGTVFDSKNVCQKSWKAI